MKTASFLLLGLLFGFARSTHGEKPENHGHPKDCRPSEECLANGGYCIRNTQKRDCKGFLFSKECTSAHCSCCIDAPRLKDECTTGEDTCPTNSQCKDKSVGYDCVCDVGYIQCGDMNECGSNPCGANSQCRNTYGSYDCICNAGFQKIGGSCVDINECNPNPCGPNGVCSNTPGSFSCNCNAGYVLTNGNCVDVDECLTHPCYNNSVCTNTNGSYLCECLPGYRLTGGDCVDINECASSPCQDNENCTNTPGSYSCDCFVCRNRCEFGGTFLTEPYLLRCIKMIKGNMTYQEADARCSEDFNGMTFVKDEVFSIAIAFGIPNTLGMAWIKGIFKGNSNGTCMALINRMTTQWEEISCDTKLQYAFCDVVKNW